MRASGTSFAQGAVCQPPDHGDHEARAQDNLPLGRKHTGYEFFFPGAANRGGQAIAKGEIFRANHFRRVAIDMGGASFAPKPAEANRSLAQPAPALASLLNASAESHPDGRAF